MGTVPDLDISYHVEAADDSARFLQAADWVCQRYELKSLTASISIVDDPTIHELNREHLNHDWPTDVISFVFENLDGNVDGEIIASHDTATKLAYQAGWSVQDELLLYVTHGLLHLAGLDDIQDVDRTEMRLAEQRCLLELGLELATEHLRNWDDISY